MNKTQYEEAFLDTCIKNIKKAHDGNYLSIFAGAGISANSGLPEWGTLMKDISKELYGDKKDKKDKKDKENKEDKEDNLVLAEKFYNQFGENYYYQKLNEYVPNDAKPHELHKKIVKLNPKNLITTNWDNLFEKAIDEEGCFYNIIKKDEDIGFATGFSKLIKMHGSLEDYNIVFKEEDYLRYSDNFPLIENYIKGIFSTDLVLLMGYSLSDNNVKQIISWINSKANNIKPIYFIKIDKNFDHLEFDFYKNKNIYILYLNEIYKKDTYQQFLYNLFYNTNINNNPADILNHFLNNLDDEDFCDLKTLDNQKINDKVEEFLEKYKNCKFVFAHSFIRDFKRYFKLDTKDISFDIDYILISNEKLAKFVKNENYKTIANLTKTLIYVNNQYLQPDYSNVEDISNILYFNYDDIEKRIKKLSLKYLSDDEELSLAFWLYQNEHYIQSYNTLKRVSKNAFKNKDYPTWFISEINRKNFIFKDVTEENEDEIRIYLKEMNEIDVDELYLKLPKKNRLEVKFLKELESFMDKNLIKINELQEKISRDYNNYKNGGFSINNNIYLINNIFQKIFSIEIDLKLINSLESIYGNIIKSFLIHLAYIGLQEEKRAKKQNNSEENIFIDIDIYLFSFAIKYVKNQDLKKILSEYFKQNYILKLNNEDIDKIYINICKNFTTQGFIETTYSQLFDNFLVFSSWMDLTQENFNLIIDNFNKKLEKHLLGIPQYDSMSYFLSNQYYKNKNIDFSNITNIIKTYISAFLNGKFGEYNISALQYSNAFNNIFGILISKKIKLEDNFNPKISDFITYLKDKKINIKYYYVRYFLGQLSHIATEDIQKEIDKFNLEIYNQVKNENIDLYTLELGFCLYSDKKISKEEYEKVFFEIEERAKKEYSDFISNMKYSNLTNIMFILDFIEKNKKKLEKIVEE
ncbi:SIR2 family protein [Campylobacter sp. RM9939]|uniref:SIR2 family protein n=1 Tax=Campylobacter molothri TaxID=1032242 RepID=UPI00301D0FAE|nr:SIR2 family protein [Campylobacter sp. RM9939]